MTQTQSYLNSLYSYDPTTGVITSKVNAGRWKAGRVLGCLNKQLGYLVCRVGPTLLYAHRMAWIMVNGEIPDGLAIDHINGLRTDNRLSNLRLADSKLNNENRNVVNKNNSLGVSGVHYDVERGKYVASLLHNGSRVLYSRFDTIEEAKSAYTTQKARYHKGWKLGT